MKLKNQYDLAKISTTIGTLARGQEWSTSAYTKGESYKVTEVQCAFFEDEERIFIACNKGEHDQVLTALNSCGVTTIASLLEVLEAAHGVFYLQDGDRNRLGIKHSYSKQDRTAYDLVHATDASYGSMAMTDPQIDKVKAASKVANTTLPPGITAADVWMFRKLSGKKVETARPSGSLRTVKGPDNVREQTINIIVNSEDAHAELAILKFLTRGLVEGVFTKSKIYLGGRKVACANCKTWIDNYKKVLKAGVTLHTPEDARSETQTNPGTCPSGFVPALTVTVTSKLRTTEPMFDKLFSGERIDGVTWPAIAAETVAVQPQEEAVE